ncbi:lysoplasmalogenase [Pseudomonas mangrovi]|uniref:Lysoplasmalogenase n=1 Tax=Pseudomonas mangrovi TaxID=2161748 RepID=A0A2T5PEE9_9PSED|nr:lysoplasmalogenase [Pseudomonas mangrovi]PTU76109.1 hypothetical protein DBO85_00265 [Pseudomonas mangrovi]
MNPRLWLGLGLCGAGLFFAGVYLQLPLLCLLAKPLPVLALIGWLQFSADTLLRRPIQLGLAVSLAGDILLAWPGDLFLAGLCAFFFAHLIYLHGFTRDCRRPAWIALGIAGALAGGMYGLLFLGGLGDLELPVLVYSLAIAAMLWRALARPAEGGLARRSVWLGALGALLFVISDSLIGFDRFLLPIPDADYPILASYWLGQWGIAAAARFAQPTREFG